MICSLYNSQFQTGIYIQFQTGRLIEWCKIVFGFVQQLADQVAGGSLEGFVAWAAKEVNLKGIRIRDVDN